jgi:hypothetical protein
VTLPKDFSSWISGNALQVNYQTTDATPGNNLVDLYVYTVGSDTLVTSDVNNASASWTTIDIADTTLDAGNAQDWDAAGETAILYLRMGSQSSNVARVGDIVLNYYSAY